MNQRGILKSLVDLVYAYGTDCGDKITLTKKDAHKHLHECKSELKGLSKLMYVGSDDLVAVMLKVAEIEQLARNFAKIIDKQGMTVVVVEEALITTYRLETKFYMH
jgi:predicted SPOUT superfamily RNA methylase MTH1